MKSLNLNKIINLSLAVATLANTSFAKADCIRDILEYQNNFEQCIGCDTSPYTESVMVAGGIVIALASTKKNLALGIKGAATVAGGVASKAAPYVSFNVARKLVIASNRPALDLLSENEVGIGPHLEEFTKLTHLESRRDLVTRALDNINARGCNSVLFMEDLIKDTIKFANEEISLEKQNSGRMR